MSEPSLELSPPPEVVPYQPPLVFIQNACLLHDPGNLQDRGGLKIPERPERLRSVNVGVASLYARLEESFSELSSDPGPSQVGSLPPPIRIVRSTAKVESFTEHPATKDVMHIQKDGNLGERTYAEELPLLCEQSGAKIEAGEREIPESWEPDLYLCPGTLEAVKGALGTVCQAVDEVTAASRGEVKFEDLDPSSLAEAMADSPRPTKAFAAIRPPGELCVSDTPAGRGLVNNVAVAAMHAFEQHSFGHIVIFDIDLYYGKGTHDFATEVNRQAADVFREGGTLPRIFYGGLHDVSVYPCTREQNYRATGAQQGIIGDWYANVALFDDEDGVGSEDFELAYIRYLHLLWEAQDFLTSRGAEPKDVIVLMSCGFTASEHESTDLRRKNHSLPTDFYRRFTRHVCKFADKYAQGRLVSVLAGGFSERALVSGVMAHLSGMLDPESHVIDTRWWSTPNLEQYANTSTSNMAPHWVRRTRQIADCLNEEYEPTGRSTTFLPPANLPPEDPHSHVSTAEVSAESGSSTQSQSQTEASVSVPLQWAPPLFPESLQSPPALASCGKGKGRAVSDSASGLQVAGTSQSTADQTTAPASSSSRKRNAPNTEPGTHSKRARPAPPASSVAAPNDDIVDSALVEAAYNELKESLDTFVALVNTNAANLPRELVVALRPIKGCVWQLANGLGEAGSVREAITSLYELSQAWHNICKTLEDRDMARRLNIGLYAFEGALLDLKNTMGPDT